MSPSPTSELLTPAQVAEALGISEKTLANRRSARTGPPIFRTRGVIRYPTRAFEQWIKDNTEEMDETQVEGQKMALPVRRRAAQVAGRHRLGGYITQEERRLAKLEGHPDSSILPLRNVKK